MQNARPTDLKPTRHPLGRPCLIPSLIFSTLLFVAIPAHAQLPAGSIDTTQPQIEKADPILNQANEALEKQDYPTALKLLTTLTEKSPNDPHLLYDLAFTQDALAETPAQTATAETTYRRAITADPKYFDPHLGLGLLLARSGKLPLAHAELLEATTLTTDNPLLKARAYRALARIDQTSNPAIASDELLSALKISPETTDDVLLSGELAGGENLVGRSLAIDQPLGQGHVVMFALRPFWRWQTQGTFALGFNTIVNWDHLDAGKPAPRPRGPGAAGAATPDNQPAEE